MTEKAKDGKAVAAETPSQVAAAFGLALGRLQARIKQEGGTSAEGITPSQLAMLQRLRDAGGLSVTQLAAAEHVSQQAITQRLALLAPTGYVSVGRDARDGRRKVVTITAAGAGLLDRVASAQETWLDRAISQTASSADLETLAQVARIMEQLAGSDIA